MTNFETIRGRVNKLRELEAFLESGAANKLPKKEVAQLNRQLAKLSCVRSRQDSGSGECRSRRFFVQFAYFCS